MSSAMEHNQKSIARRQFAPLPKEWRNVLAEHLELISECEDGEPDPDYYDENEINSGYGHEPITNADLRSLIERFEVDELNVRATGEMGSFNSISQNVVNSYLHLICEYKNIDPPSSSSIIPEREPAKSPVKDKEIKRSRGRSRSPEKHLPKKTDRTYRSRSELRSSNKPASGSAAISNISCRYIDVQSWQTILHYQFRNPDQYGKKLADLDLSRQNLQNLDYLFIPIYQNGHYALVGIAPKQKFIFAIDSLTIRDEDYNKNHDTLRPVLFILLMAFGDTMTDWPLYGQWSSRTKTTDKSPNAAQQSDMYNCGVFTVTNAMCLAFGYDLMCYKQRDLDDGKRQRVAAELLHGGFKDPFDYQKLKIPYAQVPTVVDSNGERFSGPAPVAVAPTPDGAIVPGKRSKPISPIPRVPISVTPKGQWPAQFDPRSWQKAGFLYAIKKPMFRKLRYKYELKAACEEHNIEGYQHWDKQPVDIFRRWMENVMEGRKAARDGRLKQFAWDKSAEDNNPSEVTAPEGNKRNGNYAQDSSKSKQPKGQQREPEVQEKPKKETGCVRILRNRGKTGKGCRCCGANELCVQSSFSTEYCYDDRHKRQSATFKKKYSATGLRYVR